ncbi:MAG: hypothetical protein Q4D38_08630 [Planctomycetia bacterium]|nr:hypothetical protein [Planctomycetia bacterium]
MNERTMQLRLGIAVLASLVIIAILLTFLGSQKKFSSSGYTIYIQLADAPGVMENTPIYQSGILIGRVSKVDLVRDKGVLVTARIFHDHVLYTDQQCNLTTTLLGDASLRMVKTAPEEGKPPVVGEPLDPGATIVGKIAFDPVAIAAKMQDRLSLAIDDVSRAASQLEQVASSTNLMVGENRETIQGILLNAQAITTDSRVIVRGLSEIMDEDFRANIQQSVEALPITLRNIDETFVTMRTSVESAVGSMEQTTQNVNAKMEHVMERVDKTLDLTDSVLDNVNKITTPIASKTEIWVTNLDSILQNMDILMENVNNPNGTLSLLLRDRALYDQLSRTVEGFRSLPQQLEPILFNAQVFSEKIAQHPELLGVRGAMKSDSGGSRSIPWPKGISEPTAESYLNYGAPVPSYSSEDADPYRRSVVMPHSAQYAPPTQRQPTQSPLTQSGSSVESGASAQSAQKLETIPSPPPARVLHPAERTNLHPAQPLAEITQQPQSVEIPVENGEITPEMLNMSEEEFRNADIAQLSDVFLVPRVPDENAAPMESATPVESGAPIGSVLETLPEPPPPILPSVLPSVLP